LLSAPPTIDTRLNLLSPSCSLYISFKKSINTTHLGSHQATTCRIAPPACLALLFSPGFHLSPVPAARQTFGRTISTSGPRKRIQRSIQRRKNSWRILRQRSISTRSSTDSWKVSWHPTFFSSFILGHANLEAPVGGSAAVVGGV